MTPFPLHHYKGEEDAYEQKFEVLTISDDFMFGIIMRNQSTANRFGKQY